MAAAAVEDIRIGAASETTLAVIDIIALAPVLAAADIATAASEVVANNFARSLAALAGLPFALSAGNQSWAA